MSENKTVIKTITKNICLDYKYLDSDIYKNISDITKKTYINYCDQIYGYILKIHDIRVLSNTISTASPNIFFRVEFDAEVIKPEINQVYTGKVVLIFPQGIFVEVEKIRILIPADKLTSFKYNKALNIFKGKKPISKGDDISVVITMVKYEKQSFNCIGKLKT